MNLRRQPMHLVQLLSVLREHALIVPVLGEGKGKYRFNGCKSGGEANLVKYKR